MEIEEVAATSPDALVRLHVDPLEGCHPWHARRLVYDGWRRPTRGAEADRGDRPEALRRVRRAEAMLCEINPLIVTPEGEVRALDSKFTVDDNALFRHPDIAELRDVSAADPLEALAREKGVTYVKLDGEVGVLGNGAVSRWRPSTS
jgi:succinyl-CoA synthetase beta subunit